MKMKGDKNSALNAADVPPDGQTESFNQPEKEETHNTRTNTREGSCRSYAHT